VRQRLERCAVEGLAGLDDAPRSGRPRPDSEDVSRRVVAKARGLPPTPADGEEEEPPTCHWTLDRLQADLANDGLTSKRSPIRRILTAEHLKWPQPRTGLERTDRDFAEKRAVSSGATLRRRRAAR
jgi:Homeodomain-like domain